MQAMGKQENYSPQLRCVCVCVCFMFHLSALQEMRGEDMTGFFITYSTDD